MSALDIAAAVRSGERSAVDVIDEHLARIAAGDGGAGWHVRARASDERSVTTSSQPLISLPIPCMRRRRAAKT